MKGESLFLFATLLAASQALDIDPIDAIPYCRPVENGFTTDANGELFVVSDYFCWGIAIAIFHNGQNTGFNLTFATSSNYDGFWTVVMDANSTYNPSPTLGVLYDVGNDYCSDEHDGYGGVKRTFYFPKAPSEAWGRVVDEVHNPTNADIKISIGYHNNLGSDYTTHFFNATERYSFSGDSDNITNISYDANADNLVSFHWTSFNATSPDGFHSNVVFKNGTVLLPFNEGNDDVIPYWNVTIPAGKTMTFMMIMNQGGYDFPLMYESVKDIDTNPLKLYVDMTADQLTTLHNFNPCVATVPQLSTNVTPKTACSSFGGNAEFDLTSYIGALEWTPNVNISITAHGSDGSIVTSNKDNVIVVPSGTYDVKLTFAQCGINIGQVTVTCPDAPVTAPSVSQPTSKTTSSASTVMIGMLVALSVITHVFLQ